MSELTKEIVIGTITITQYKQLQVRDDTVVSEDGVELSRTYHRYVVAPGDDVSDKPQLVQDLATLLWTPEVIAEWESKKPVIV